MEHRSEKPAADDVWHAYRRLSARLAASWSRELAAHTGLSEADADVLCHLAQTGCESMRALELRCGLEWEKSRLSHQLRRMEQRGLVVRQECADDQRGSVVVITAEGSTLAQQARTIQRDFVRTHFAETLSEEQLRQLAAITAALLQSTASTVSHR